jgi:hypothetical protein
VTRPGLPIFTRFYQAKIIFLVTLICNDLPKSCCIVHLDQCYAVSVPIVFLFYLSTGVRAKRATASSSCCFDDFPLRLHLFMSLRPDSVGSWRVSFFFDMGFRSSALHTAFLKDTFAADNRANWGWRLHFFAFSERCNDFGNDYTFPL